MKFQPKQANKISGAPREFKPLPTPGEGSQAARVSLIVDAGEQYQQPFKDKDGVEVIPKNQYVQECILFVDLVDEEVEYPEPIGKKPFRFMLNKNFMGSIQGTRFEGKPLRDAAGMIIPNKLETFHPKNLFYTLAQATSTTNILGQNNEENMDILQLLNKPLYIDISVEKKPSGKMDAEGKEIIYTNIRYKSLTKVPRVKGTEVDVAPLSAPAMLVSFEDAFGAEGGTPLERLTYAVKFLRKDVITKIRLARNYEGSLISTLLGARETEQHSGYATSAETSVIASQEAVAEAIVKVTGTEDDVSFAEDELGTDSPF